MTFKTDLWPGHCAIVGAIRWAGLSRVHGGASACSVVCVEEQADWQAEQSRLHTGLSELAWGCWLCNKAFNGHTASPRLPGATTKSLFTVTRPDVTDLFISLCRLVHPSSGSSTHKMLFFSATRFSSPLHATSEGRAPRRASRSCALISWKGARTWRFSLSLSLSLCFEQESEQLEERVECIELWWFYWVLFNQDVKCLHPKQIPAKYI